MKFGIVAVICIHLCGCDWDASRGSVIKEVVTASKAVKELRITPGSNDLDRRLDSVERQFEPDLVISLAGCAVADILTTLPLSSTHLSSGDNRTGQAGACVVLCQQTGLDGVGNHAAPSRYRPS